MTTTFPYTVDVAIHLSVRPGSRDKIINKMAKLSDVNLWLGDYEYGVDYVREIIDHHLTYHFADADTAVVFKLTFGGS